MKEVEDLLSYRAIGLAIDCHRELGPGLDEILYHELLAEKLGKTGVPHQFKPKGRLMHRWTLADEFEADLIVRDELVLELKVLWDDFAPEHLLQTMCYIKFWRLRAGLLFDFGKESLVTQRVVFTPPLCSFDRVGWIQSAPAWIVDRDLVEVLGLAIENVVREHGLGYRTTTYRGLLVAELAAMSLDVQQGPPVPIRTDEGIRRKESSSQCLLVAGRCAFLVNALRDTRQAADRAVLQTYVRHLDLPWGVTINFGKRGLETRFVAPARKAH
jgi:GxxExxY protein